MSAQASGGAGGDDEKPKKASRCKTCGNRHEGACWPKCDTCGKIHKGTCRYANPASSVGFGNAGQEPSQAEMTARFNAQQAGYQAGYLQAHNDMRLSGMVPEMGPGMGGPVYGPVGGFVSPYAGQYGGYVRPVAPSWSYPVPGSFGQAYAGFPSPAYGQGTFGTFGNASQPTGNYAGYKQGAAEGHEIQKKIRRPRENRKERSKGQSIDKKDILATKDAGIEKPASRRARGKAKKQASEEKKRKEEPPKNPLTGETDVEILHHLPQQEGESNVLGNTVNDERMEDVAAQDNVGIDSSIIDAQSLIDEATRNPSGFQFPQDQARVETMANLLAQFGQDRLVRLSEIAEANSTSIVWEAVQHESLLERSAERAAKVPLPEGADEEL